jgi:hypothetical protein
VPKPQRTARRGGTELSPNPTRRRAGCWRWAQTEPVMRRLRWRRQPGSASPSMGAGPRRRPRSTSFRVRAGEAGHQRRPSSGAEQLRRDGRGGGRGLPAAGPAPLGRSRMAATPLDLANPEPYGEFAFC